MSSYGTAIKISIGERVFNVINYVVMILFMLICIYPFYYVIIYSISDPTQAAGGVFLLPAGLELTSYKEIFEKGDILWAFLVSVARTVLGTIICVGASSFFAYLVTKKEMVARKFIYRFVIVTMYLNAGLIPWYLTMKAYGLRDNFLLYILPGAVNAFYMILIKTYIEQLPPSLEESASLDGAGVFTIFSKIILPISKPIIATVTVYCAVGQWNTWTDNFFLVSDTRLQTVQLILYNYLNNAQAIADSMRNSAGGVGITASSISPESVQMAVIVIAVVPIMMVYPFLQKYFAKGIMMGAIKG